MDYNRNRWKISQETLANGKVYYMLWRKYGSWPFYEFITYHKSETLKELVDLANEQDGEHAVKREWL